MSYPPRRGLPEHREAGAFWLSREGCEVSAEQMAVTAGAHHGVLVALAAVTRPGEHIVSDSLSYPGVRSLSRMLGLRLDGMARVADWKRVVAGERVSVLEDRGDSRIFK